VLNEANKPTSLTSTSPGCARAYESESEGDGGPVYGLSETSKYSCSALESLSVRALFVEISLFVSPVSVETDCGIIALGIAELEGETLFSVEVGWFKADDVARLSSSSNSGVGRNVELLEETVCEGSSGIMHLLGRSSRRPGRGDELDDPSCAFSYRDEVLIDEEVILRERIGAFEISTLALAPPLFVLFVREEDGSMS